MFRGSEGAFKSALDEIRVAVRAIGGEHLIKAIDDSAILSDPALFRRIWVMAGSTNQGGARS